MTLLLVFVVLTVGLFALFLGGSVVAQGYLYQEPAGRMPLRALVGAVLLGGFLTLWAAIDKNSPGRYDTFFNFASYTSTEFTEFEAVRWAAEGGKLKADAAGGPVESVVKFKRSAGGKGAAFVQEGTNEAFKLSGTDPTAGQYMTGAIRVKAADDPAPVRYNAVLTEDPRTKAKTYPDPDQRRFVEEKGSRYVTVAQPGTLFVPSNKTIVVALLLNFMLLVVWFVVAWPVLRYTLTHALGLAAVATVVTLLALMPLLFRYNRAPPPPPAAAQAGGTSIANPV